MSSPTASLGDRLVVLDEVAELRVALVADGVLEATGSWLIFDLAHLVGVTPMSVAISSGVGSRPRSWTNGG